MNEATDWVMIGGHFIRVSAVERFYVDNVEAHITLSSGTYTYRVKGDPDELERRLRLAFCGRSDIPLLHPEG